MGEAMITRRGGGGKLNALVEQYQVAAGGSVSANGFVKFVDDLSTHQVQPYNYPEVSACALSDTLVLVVYTRKELYSDSYYCSAVIIENGTITSGTRTTIAEKSSGNSYGYSKCIAISESTALVLCAATRSIAWRYLLVTVNADSTITINESNGNLANLTAGTYTANYPTSWQPITLNNNSEFIIIENYADGSRIWAHVFKIENNAVKTSSVRSKYLTIKNASTGEGAEGFVVAKIDVGKYIAIRRYSAGTSPKYTYYRDAYIITDSGSALTISAPTVIMSHSSDIIAMCDAIAISTDKVLFVYSPNGNTSAGAYLCGRLLTINGTSITVSRETKLSSNRYTYNTPNNSNLSNYYNRVISSQYGGWLKTEKGQQLILHPNVASPTYALQLAVSGDMVTTLSEDVLIAQDTSQASTVPVLCTTVQTSNGKRLVYTTVNSKLTGTMLSTAINVATSGTVDGVAKDNASTGETVDVYRPA